jgi:hypothetical protein
MEYSSYISAKDLAEALVGKTVKKVYMNEHHLKFETDQGNFVYGVEGDCCSRSYFYDFYGIKNLLNNGPITEIKDVELLDEEKPKDDAYEDIKLYGYQITTESPKFGPVTSVFSFRNSSNGYYGGSMQGPLDDRVVEPELTKDLVGTD